jgi:hypothetical protein
MPDRASSLEVTVGGGLAALELVLGLNDLASDRVTGHGPAHEWAKGIADAR